MTYSKNLESYPEEFGSLIEAGALGGVTLPMPSAPDAKRLAGRLYAYKGALKKEVQDNPDCGDLVRNLYRLSQKCQMRAECSLLILRPMDRDPDAMLIRSLLEGGLPVAPSTAERPSTGRELGPNEVLVPINMKHLPPWLAEMAVKRAEDFKK
jgi:hypothetical protein